MITGSAARAQNANNTRRGGAAAAYGALADTYLSERFTAYDLFNRGQECIRLHRVQAPQLEGSLHGYVCGDEAYAPERANVHGKSWLPGTCAAVRECVQLRAARGVVCLSGVAKERCNRRREKEKVEVARRIAALDGGNERLSPIELGFHRGLDVGVAQLESGVVAQHHREVEDTTHGLTARRLRLDQRAELRRVADIDRLSGDIYAG